jgi:hypothetical protein
VLEYPIPQLDDPRAFDEWRVNVTRASIETFNAAIAALIELNNPLANLRAALMQTTSNSQQARELASKALMSNDQSIHLMAKAYLAYFHFRQAWSGNETPKFSSQATPLVLENILEEIKSLRERSPLSIEAQMRTHAILADAYLVGQNFSGSKINAAESIILAEALGMTSFTLIGKYQLASTTHNEGNVSNAANLYKVIIEDRAIDPGLAGRAVRARILSLDALGDEDSIEGYLNSSLDMTTPTARAQTAAFRLSTLRFGFKDFNQDSLEAAGNYSRLVALLNYSIMSALSVTPDEPTLILSKYRDGYKKTIRPTEIAFGWMRYELQALTCFLLLRINEVGLALQRTLTKSDLEKLPPAKKAFALCVAIEVMVKVLPDSSESLVEALIAATECFLNFEERIAKQVAARLQILTPLALALTARFPGVTDAVVNAGNNTILNFTARKIRVYDAEGLRPVQAVRFILEAFQIDTEFLGRSGGGQATALHQALYHPYHHTNYWYTPITALQVNFALLCCRDVMQDKRLQLMLNRSIKELRLSYGYLPKLQKIDQPQELTLLETILNQFEKSQITSQQAHQALLGKGERL